MYKLNGIVQVPPPPQTDVGVFTLEVNESLPDESILIWRLDKLIGREVLSCHMLTFTRAPSHLIQALKVCFGVVGRHVTVAHTRVPRVDARCLSLWVTSGIKLQLCLVTFMQKMAGFVFWVKVACVRPSTHHSRHFHVAGTLKPCGSLPDKLGRQTCCYFH